MDLIYCAGGNKKLAEIAISYGFLYGARSDDIRDLRCEGMIDINWKEYIWENHISAIEEHRPKYAVIPDIFHLEDIDILIDQAEQVIRLGAKVIAVPKAHDLVKNFSNDWIVGVSVPSTYAGFLPNINELHDKDVHLLGGSPTKQRELWDLYTNRSINITSVDINSHNKASNFGAYWDGDKWIHARGKTVGKYEAFDLSCRGIIKMWKNKGVPINGNN